MTDWENVVAYEIFQNGKLVFVSPLNRFTVENVTVDAKTKVYAIGANGKRKKVNFQWTEDPEQQKNMKERELKYKNMYNR